MARQPLSPHDRTAAGEANPGVGREVPRDDSSHLNREMQDLTVGVPATAVPIVRLHSTAAVFCCNGVLARDLQHLGGGGGRTGLLIETFNWADSFFQILTSCCVRLKRMEVCMPRF